MLDLGWADILCSVAALSWTNLGRMQYNDIVQLNADYVLQCHGCNLFCCFIKISRAISYNCHGPVNLTETETEVCPSRHTWCLYSIGSG